MSLKYHRNHNTLEFDPEGSWTYPGVTVEWTTPRVEEEDPEGEQLLRAEFSVRFKSCHEPLGERLFAARDLPDLPRDLLVQLLRDMADHIEDIEGG